MVKTPWFDEDIPFEEAAVVGTKKVIEEHSTVAVLVTTDGSIGDIKDRAMRQQKEKPSCSLRLQESHL